MAKKMIKKKHPLKAIIAVVIVGLVFAAGLVMILKTNPRADLAMRELFSLSDKIRKNYTNRADYWGLNTSSLLSQNITANLKNSINKEIVVGRGFEGEVLMPGSKTFDIVYKGLTKSECVAMSSFDLSKIDNLGLIIIKINDDDFTFSWGGENSLPIKASIAKKLCGAKDNKILWEFE